MNQEPPYDQRPDDQPQWSQQVPPYRRAPLQPGQFQPLYRNIPPQQQPHGLWGWYKTRTRSMKLGLGCGTLIAILLLCSCVTATFGGGASILSQSSSSNQGILATPTSTSTSLPMSTLSPTPTFTPTPTAIPTLAPTPTPKPTQLPKQTPTPTIHLYKVGEKAVTGGYTITLEYTEKVEDSYIVDHGYGPASKPGEYYLGVTTTVHTPADGQRHPLFRSQLTLTDAEGNAMKGVTTTPSSFNPAPDIDIALLRIFVVKSNVHSYILTFDPLVTGAAPVMWKVEV